jgi:hypothetical protein
MNKFTVAIVAGMAFLGVLVMGCESKQAEQKPASEQAPVKKAPQGC